MAEEINGIMLAVHTVGSDPDAYLACDECGDEVAMVMIDPVTEGRTVNLPCGHEGDSSEEPDDG